MKEKVNEHVMLDKNTMVIDIKNKIQKAMNIEI